MLTSSTKNQFKTNTNLEKKTNSQNYQPKIPNPKYFSEDNKKPKVNS